MDALGNDSALAANRTSLTPCAMMARALSSLSLPLRALSAALCHARQISSACFLSLFFLVLGGGGGAGVCVLLWFFFFFVWVVWGGGGGGGGWGGVVYCGGG